MRRNPLLLGDRIKRVINRDAMLVSHVVIGGIILLDTILNNSLNNSEKLSIYIFLVVMSLLGLARYINFKNINNYPAIHLTMYHVLIGAGIIFLAPIGSNYVFVWLIILFLTNFFFGLKATVGSGMLLALVLELQLLWNASKLDNGIVGSDITVVLAQLGITFAVAMFFVDTQSVTDQDRHLLVTSMDKAQLERQRLVSLINSMVDAVIATDELGAVKLYNAASMNLLDTNEDLTGKQIQDYMKLENDKEQLVDFLTLTGEGTTSFHSRDLTLGSNHDERMNISLSISPIKLGFRRDSERGYIITFRDITREKSLEEERDEFISVISHELRTPVAITEANISNAIFMAENKKDSAQTLDSLKAAHKQALFLAGMLNDLSTLSRAEKGKLDHTFEILDPKELVDDLIKDYTNDAKAKGLKLKKQVAKSAPKQLVSNRLYVKEILQNFITNAIKYTHEGTVTVSLDARADGSTAIFSVTDSGIGISKSDQKKIFEKFYRSEDFRTRESSGTGLGLYITKKLASILGAKFEVSSKLNEGSTFSVIIPSQQQTQDIPK